MPSRGLPLTSHRGLTQSRLCASPTDAILYNKTSEGTTQAISLTADDASTSSQVPFIDPLTRTFAAPLVTHHTNLSGNSGNNSQKTMQSSRINASSSFGSYYTKVNVNASDPFLGNRSMTTNSSSRTVMQSRVTGAHQYSPKPTHDPLDCRYFDQEAAYFAQNQEWFGSFQQMMWSKAEGYYTSTMTTTYASSWDYVYSYPTFTLADGMPRVTTSYVVRSSLWYTSAEYEVADVPEIPWPPLSHCTTHCGPCTIEELWDGEIQMLYWPPSPSKLLSPATTARILDQAVSVVYHGHTLHSPTVYVSFNTLVATDNCGDVGMTHSNVLVPVSSADVSSIGLPPFTTETFCILGICFDELPFSLTPVPYRFNFDDLTGPVPASVYTRQPFCQEEGCDTISPNYAPRLSIPSQIRNVDPAWGSCLLSVSGANDPPYVLTAASVEAMVTPASDPQSTPIVPRPKDPLPSPTATRTLSQPVQTGFFGFPDLSEHPSTDDPSHSDNPPEEALPDNEAPPSPDIMISPHQQQPPRPDPGHGWSQENQDDSEPDSISNDQHGGLEEGRPGGKNSAPGPFAGNRPSNNWPVSTNIWQGPPTPITVGGHVISNDNHGNWVFDSFTLDPKDVGVATMLQKVQDIAYRAWKSQGALDPASVKGLPRASFEKVDGGYRSRLGGIPIFISDEAADKLIDSSNVSGQGRGGSYPLMTIGGHVFSADAEGRYLIDGQTLSPGGSIIYRGTPLAIDAGGSYMILGSKTSDVGSARGPPTPDITSGPSGSLLIGDQKLTPGGAVTYSGTRLSLDSDGTHLIIGSKFVSLNGMFGSAEHPEITATPKGDLMFDGHHLTRGGIITISGTRVSFGLDGSYIVIGSSTEWFAAKPTESLDPALASSIMHAFLRDDSGTTSLLDPAFASEIMRGFLGDKTRKTSAPSISTTAPSLQDTEESSTGQLTVSPTTSSSAVAGPQLFPLLTLFSTTWTWLLWLSIVGLTFLWVEATPLLC